ncbi:MAG: hypothetical protein Ct9H300mP25_17110 [Acidobacteriota bacterium]|nr:MAG: hypothetical protein Ct9H300mP25_17110 [Acidobacteriota bacterium]
MKKFTPHASCCSRFRSELSLRVSPPAPGCGRTTSSTFQELAEQISGIYPQHDARMENAIQWRRRDDRRRHGLCRQWAWRIQSGKHRISLPGTGEEPSCPVFIDGQHTTTLRGSYEELFEAFHQLIDKFHRNYLREKTPRSALSTLFGATINPTIAIDIDGTLLDSHGKLPPQPISGT